MTSKHACTHMRARLREKQRKGFASKEHRSDALPPGQPAG